MNFLSTCILEARISFKQPLIRAFQVVPDLAAIRVESTKRSKEILKQLKFQIWGLITSQPFGIQKRSIPHWKAQTLKGHRGWLQYKAVTPT